MDIKTDPLVVESAPPEVLGAVGGLAGSAIGIATAGLGAPAIVPLGALGLYVGYKLGGWIARRRDGINPPECGGYFRSCG